MYTIPEFIDIDGITNNHQNEHAEMIGNGITFIHNTLLPILQEEITTDWRSNRSNNIAKLQRLQTMIPKLIDLEYKANQHWLDPDKCDPEIPYAGIPKTYVRYHMESLLAKCYMARHPHTLLVETSPEARRFIRTFKPEHTRLPGQRYIDTSTSKDKWGRDTHSTLIVPEYCIHMPKLGLVYYDAPDEIISTRPKAAAVISDLREGLFIVRTYKGKWVRKQIKDYTLAFDYDEAEALERIPRVSGVTSIQLSSDMPSKLDAWEVPMLDLDFELPF